MKNICQNTLEHTAKISLKQVFSIQNLFHVIPKLQRKESYVKKDWYWLLFADTLFVHLVFFYFFRLALHVLHILFYILLHMFAFMDIFTWLYTNALFFWQPWALEHATLWKIGQASRAQATTGIHDRWLVKLSRRGFIGAEKHGVVCALYMLEDTGIHSNHF